jgi:DNA-binding MurR/RpiR family transcriptional regulator
MKDPMAKKQSLEDYEDLIREIHEKHDDMSKSYQRIAVYLTQNPNDVAIRSVNSIAESCGIHASSFVRFAQSLGYKGFKELQEIFQRRLSTAAPGFEARIKALEGELIGGKAQGNASFLQELVLRDIASLQELLANVSNDALGKAVTLMDKADTIFLLGQLRSAPVVELLRYVLTMLGKRTVLLDASGGLATHMAKVMTPRDLLIAVSFRFYATEVVNVAEDVSSRGIAILAITDSTLSPLAKCARILFTVPEHEYTFSRSLAAPMCVAQALVVSLAAKLQKDKAPRIPTVTQP